jgi:anti-sigma B factor antagonist
MTILNKLMQESTMVVKIINLSAMHSDKNTGNNIAVKINAADVYDIDGAAEISILFKILIEGGVQKIIIDMDGLEFIDSRGITTLIAAAKQIRENKGDIVLVHVPEKIERIFLPVNLQRYIKIYASIGEAIQYLKFL